MEAETIEIISATEIDLIIYCNVKWREKRKTGSILAVENGNASN